MKQAERKSIHMISNRAYKTHNANTSHPWKLQQWISKKQLESATSNPIDMLRTLESAKSYWLLQQHNTEFRGPIFKYFLPANLDHSVCQSSVCLQELKSGSTNVVYVRINCALWTWRSYFWPLCMSDSLEPILSNFYLGILHINTIRSTQTDRCHYITNKKQIEQFLFLAKKVTKAREENGRNSYISNKRSKMKTDFFVVCQPPYL